MILRMTSHCGHILLMFLLLRQGSTTPEPTESPTVYCFGVEYTDQLGEDFIQCANKTKNEVLIESCEVEDQAKLEFAIANKLYEFCWRPHCVYFSMDLAFRWMSAWNCYRAIWNTGDQNQCWEAVFNSFYKSGELNVSLEAICYGTAAPTFDPSQVPTLVPTLETTQLPTIWCDGAEYSDELGAAFIACGSKTIDLPEPETCDVDNWDESEFANANDLDTNCSMPWCSYLSLDYTIYWNSVDVCFNAIKNEETVEEPLEECWGENGTVFWTTGHLESALKVVCFDDTASANNSTPAPVTTEPTKNPTLYCYGAKYTDQIGEDFIQCANTTKNEVLIEACDIEDQIKLEFGIANQLYEICWRPHCVYFNVELAFRWNNNMNCYKAMLNTGDELQCWEKAYNSFYKSGKLNSSLESICYDTAAPTPEPTPFPTQWCDGLEFREDLGVSFLACANQRLPQLTLETCDLDFQDSLFFGIANELFFNCSMPECVYVSLDWAFLWNDNNGCYSTILNNGSSKECWEENIFYSSGDLELALEAICYDTAAPIHAPTSDTTLYPTLNPTITPTLDPTPIPTFYPTSIPTLYPTVTPTPNPTSSETFIPTIAPTSTPTTAPTSIPSTVIPILYPTSRQITPTVSPTQIPTLVPTQTPTLAPTLSTTSSPTTENPTVRPTTNLSSSSPTFQPSTWPTPSPTSTVSVLVQLSGITEAHINDTVAPLARATNISEEKIRVDSYENITWSAVRRRLEVPGFLVDYLIQVLKDEKATKLVDVIMAEDFSYAFIQELAVEFNIPMKNITLQSITAESSASLTDSSNYDSWLQVGQVLSFFFGLLFLVGTIVIMVRKRAKKKERQLLESKKSEKSRTREGRKRRRRHRKRRIRIQWCCTCTCPICTFGEKKVAKKRKRRRRRDSKMSQKQLSEEAEDVYIVEDSKRPAEKKHNHETVKRKENYNPEGRNEVPSLPLLRGSSVNPEELDPSNTQRKNSTPDWTNLGQQSQKKMQSANVKRLKRASSMIEV